MTTVKTEIFSFPNGKEAVVETIYAGNQNFIYKIMGEVVRTEFFFEFKSMFAQFKTK